uniref:Aryl hydrocarbon receptor n=1 Tax=Panagrolaimus sp. ES5 TaxID=591445 RepID=A0AC34GD49_9BILA
LMDVLRDDQECINGHEPEDGNCGREILGYTSAELATFLAADENIVNNGNIYETFVQSQGSEHYPPPNYQQHCVQQHPNNITYEHQGNIEYEITGGNLEHHQTLHIEPHQEQAIDDILNNSDMMESSVEWFDNLFQSPITERQMTACGSRPPTGANIHRPMDTFV